MGQTIVLIGPNNEGKSNVLQALVTALELLGRYQIIKRPGGETQVYIRPSRTIYNWEDDFPISLQSSKAKGSTIFELEFLLNEKEILKFKKQVKSQLNGTLPIKISINKDGKYTFRIPKGGRGGNALSKKVPEISRFIREQLQFEYIPAVRTANAAERVIEDIVENQLSFLEENDEYRLALKKVTEFQQPILQELGQSLTNTIKDFLPTVKSVKIELSPEVRRRHFRRSLEVTVDDGTPTQLKSKGDGVQSLAALSLLKYSSEQSAGSKQLILAIEEPESHLHPNAIHRLKNVLEEIGEKQQVIISSHCPLFVERLNVENNIVVAKNKARPAKSIKEIRELLGVQTSDNLSHAKLALVVEGEEDKKSIIAILKNKSQKLSKKIKSGEFGVESLLGATKLSYKLSLLKDSICGVHVFIDNDQAGQTAICKAKADGFLDDIDVHYTTHCSLKESEFEDLVNPKIYIDLVKKKYGVDLNNSKFIKGKKKWSDRVRACFVGQGKVFGKEIKQSVKNVISNRIKEDPEAAMTPELEEIITSLIATLESKL